MPTTLMLAKVNILDKSQHLNNSKPHVCTSYSKLHELLVIVCRNIFVHIEGLDNRKYVSENKYLHLSPLSQKFITSTCYL